MSNVVKNQNFMKMRLNRALRDMDLLQRNVIQDDLNNGGLACTKELATKYKVPENAIFLLRKKGRDFLDRSFDRSREIFSWYVLLEELQVMPSFRELEIAEEVFEWDYIHSRCRLNTNKNPPPNTQKQLQRTTQKDPLYKDRVLTAPEKVAALDPPGENEFIAPADPGAYLTRDAHHDDFIASRDSIVLAHTCKRVPYIYFQNDPDNLRKCIGDGDPSALVFVASYAETVFKDSVNATRTTNDEEWGDIISAFLLNIYISIDSFDTQKTKFVSWAFKIFKKTILQFNVEKKRRQNRERFHRVEEVGPLLRDSDPEPSIAIDDLPYKLKNYFKPIAELTGWTKLPEIVVVAADRTINARRQNAFKPGFYEAFRRHGKSKLTSKQLAERLGCSESYLGVSLKRLRHYLQNSGISPSKPEEPKNLGRKALH